MSRKHKLENMEKRDARGAAMRSAAAIAKTARALGIGGKHFAAYANETRAAKADENVMETRIPVSFASKRSILPAPSPESPFYPYISPAENPYTPAEISGDVVVRSMWNFTKDGGIDVQTLCYLSHDLELNLLCIPYNDPLIIHPKSLFSNINCVFARSSTRFQAGDVEKFGGAKVEEEIQGLHNAAVQSVSEQIISSLALAKDSIVSAT